MTRLAPKPLYEVRVSPHFWLTAEPLRPKYTHEQFAEVIRTIRKAIDELAEKGYVDEVGWNDHLLSKRPFLDGNHFEFHVYDDDVLVVYFKREAHRVIRMVGIYDHENLPSE